MAAFLVVAVLGSLGGLAMWRASASKGAVDERAVLLAQADSLFATLEAIGHRDARISGALDGAKAETARLRSRIRRAPRDQQVLAPLRDSLDRLTSSFERLAAAAALDAQQIARTNEASLAAGRGDLRGRHAVAWPRHSRRAGPAARSSSSRCRTSCTTAPGTRAATITVQASGAAKPLRTRALAAHGALNVAILEVPKGSGTGAPPTLATSVGQRAGRAGRGAGGISRRAPGTAGAVPAQATALAAVTIANEKLLQLEPLGATLAPGSPVFDRSGTVIGMLLPGAAGAHLLDAVPAPAIAAFLSGSTGDR